MRIALIPSTPHFEDHFGKVGCSPEDLAEGRYRGTWIAQYARLLTPADVRLEVVVPTRGRPRRVSGELMDVRLVASPPLARALPARWARGPLRHALEWSASAGLVSQLAGFDVVYVQEYATGRARRLARTLPRDGVVVAAHHGTSVLSSSQRHRRALAGSGWTFTTLTELEHRSVRAAVGPDAEVRMLPNPVGAAWLEAPVPAVREGIVWVGRIEERAKGIMHALDLVELLGQRAGQPVPLRVVGSGSSEAAARERVAASALLRRSVRFHGQINDPAELIRLVSGASVFLNTSTVEGFPVSVLESLAVNTPVALRALPYVDDIARREGVTILPRYDLVASAEAIERAMWGTPRSREWIRAEYSPESFVTRFLALGERADRTVR